MGDGISEAEQNELETVTRSDVSVSSSRPRIQVPGFTILCHPDPRRVGECAALPALAKEGEIHLSRREPLFSSPGGALARSLADARISRRPIVFRPLGEGGLLLDATATSTRLTVAGQPVKGRRSFTQGELERGVVLLYGRRIVLLLHRMTPTVKRPPAYGLVGESAGIVELRREIQRVADLKMPVLLRGESGTGKELVARAIRDAGPRHDKPYFAINMAAIPPALATAELFGAAKGAFSGADRKRLGYFQRAERGTLFLDEIGEMAPEVQALLLRALESFEIQPVGADLPIRVDVRIIAATDSNLEAAIDSGQFRAPLLHRLSSYEIVMPPLRTRRDDIGRLLYHFLTLELEEVGEAYRLVPPGPRGSAWVDAEVVARLAEIDWPGNVRQLRNVARQLVVASRGREKMKAGSRVEEMLRQAVPVRPEGTISETEAVPAPESSSKRSVTFRDPSEVSEDELVEVLTKHCFSVKPAAAELRVSRTALYKMIDRCAQIRKAADLSAEEIGRAAERFDGRVEVMAEDLAVSKHGLKMRMKELGMR